MADQFSKMYDVERIGGDQRTRLAEMLRANMLNQPQGQMVSGWYVKPNWMQQLAPALGGIIGTQMGKDIEEERNKEMAELLRKRKEGVAVESPQQTVINNIDSREVQGQTPFANPPAQTELQKIAGIRPQSTEQSNFPAVAPQQQQPKYRPMTQDELDENTMQMYRVDPRMAGLMTSMEANRLSREEAKQIRAEKLASEEKLLRMQLEGKKELAQFMAGSRQAPAPVAVLDPRTGQEIFVSPSQAYGMRPAKSMQPLSVAQQKEVLDADELAQTSQNTINTLNNALKINPIAYSGIGAKERAYIRSNTPLLAESPEANATVQLENMITTQALEGLKAAFGNNPTEGERKIQLELQAAPNKTPEQRKEIIERAIAAAQNRLNFNTQKAEALRGGTYMRPGYSPITAPQQTSGMPSQNAIDAEIARRQGR